MSGDVRIGLVVGFHLDYCRKLLYGVTRFAETRLNWVLSHVEPDAEGVKALLRAKPHGIIAFVHSIELAELLRRRFAGPVVNVCGVLPNLRFPRVGVNNAIVGELAATHLLDRGFRQFGFVSHPDHVYSAERYGGFCRRLKSAGFSAFRHDCPNPLDLHHIGDLWAVDEKLQQWLRSLPKPAGIFAGNDIYGVRVLETSRQMNLKVPEEVAVVGVDNDGLLCGLARPSLSSVAVPIEKTGELAAGLLDGLLRGRAAPPRPLLLRPIAVVSRRSSEVLAIDDPELAAAIAFIRSNAHRPIQVEDVLRAVPVSRRGLERRFQKTLRRGIGQEIRRAHVERAKYLLDLSDRPIAEIAHLAGFSRGQQLSVVFRQITGLTPRAYRDHLRSSDPSQGT